ncbi:unnamed protein product [Peniophora sp. CBMAI 1063]|nr:unnamed protein product [Peniophora sp. CBMAI 1063]
MSTSFASDVAGTSAYSVRGTTRPTISMVPVEVLSQAFAHLGDDFAARYLDLVLDIPNVAEYRYVRTPDLDDEYSGHIRGIMRSESPCLIVTRVCRQWYSVAISTPQLWTCPPIFHAGGTATFLARSDAVPLEWPLVASQLRSSTLADPDRQRTLMPVLMPKTYGLLWLHNTDIQETRDSVGLPGHPISLAEVEQALSLRTDALQALYVVNRGAYRPTDQLPGQLSEPSPPPLHTLYIRARRIRADHPLLASNLQSLTLTSVASVWGDIDGMFDTLAGLPELERLVLRATARGSIVEIEPTIAVTLASERRVSLLRIQDLTLDDRMRTLAGILYGLAIPQSSFRDITITIFDEESIAGFCRALDAHYQRQSPDNGFKGFEHMCIEVGGDPKSTLIRACILHAGPGHLTLPTVARRADILSERAHFMLRTFNHTREFVSSLELLSGTPVVCLQGIAHDSVSHMYNIKWLSVDPFLSAKFVSDAAEGRLDASLMSELVVLQFEGVVFSTNGGVRESEDDPEPIDMRQLLPWLSSLSSKRTFRLLCLFDCGIKHIAQVTSLRTVLGEERLYWDGKLAGEARNPTATIAEPV